MATDAGPASNNAELLMGNVNYLEVHVGAANPTNALNPLDPNRAPYQNDPTTAYTGTIVNKTVVGVNFAIPS